MEEVAVGDIIELAFDAEAAVEGGNMGGRSLSR
jgi:hypothetical protein